MSAIVVDEGLIHYEVFGRGRPVVFVHGWLGSWRYWVPAMEELSVQQRAYALDLWGFGDSDKPGRHYTLDAYARQIHKFLDKLGVVHPTLVGHALGGVAALKFAAENPGWVDQVLAINVPLANEAINRALLNIASSTDSLVKFVSRRVKFPEVEMEIRKTDILAVDESLQSVMEHDLRRVLPTLTIPVLLLYSGNDPFVKSPERQWLLNCGDNVRALSMNGAQHFPMLEERNKFNRLLKEFLDAGDDLSTLELKEEWQRRLR